MLLLRRTSEGEDGTFGEILDEAGKKICVTCERPDNGNQKMGRIPIGIYPVKQYNSPSKGRVFLLDDVPNRSMIEIHVGNTIADTEGCILVGSYVIGLHGQKRVVESRVTLNKMLADYPNPFELKIIEEL